MTEIFGLITIVAIVVVVAGMGTAKVKGGR